MSTRLATQDLLSPREQLRYAREIILIESHSLAVLSSRLDESFCQAVDLLLACPSAVIVSGMGKAGLVGQKLAATFASTGTRSHFLHPAEAVHGDLGRIHQHDVVIVLSQSGETEEVVRLLPSLVRLRVPIVAITSRRTSSLGRTATVTLELGPLREACPLGLAPSTSTTAMLALGDALALVASRLRNFGPQDFARFHPGGSLGRRLSRVEDLMRHRHECRIADATRSVREVLVEVSRPQRRSGAILLVDGRGTLAGLFTDSDLARLFERRLDAALDRPIAEVMTAEPCTVRLGSMASDAVAMMAERKISELPVVDEQGIPVGLIDVTDVVGMLPADAA